jgi:polysaccharide biosynthesis protein PslG
MRTMAIGALRRLGGVAVLLACAAAVVGAEPAGAVVDTPPLPPTGAQPSPPDPGNRMAQMASVALHPWRLGAQASGPLPRSPLQDPGMRELTFAKLEELGVRSARIDLLWPSVEPRMKGLREWGDFDAIHASARAHGVQLLPIVAQTPTWATGGKDLWTYPEDPQDFEDFVAAAMARYPDIPAWEIWNEPNLPLFTSEGIDPAAFVDLLAAAARARARVGSAATIVSGGLSPGGMDPVGFFEEMIRLRAFDHADGFGIHPYGRKPPDQSGSFFLRMRRFHKRLVEIGKGHVGVWLTEYGAPPSRQDTTYGTALGEPEQADRLRSVYTIAARWPWVRNLTWYELRDDCTEQKAECNFGLLRSDFAEKPAYGVMRGLLAGPLPRIASRVTLGRARAARRGGGRRSVGVTGSVELPGSDGPNGRVRLALARAASPRRTLRTLKVRTRAGRYRTVLKGLRPGAWRLVAKYPGSRDYAPSSSRPLVVRIPRR